MGNRGMWLVAAALSAVVTWSGCLQTDYPVQIASPAEEQESCLLVICGDGVCDLACGEHQAGELACPDDCCLCGDGNCNEDQCGEGWREGLRTCASDCAECGNGTCDPGEGPQVCAVDCCGGCGDGKCRGKQCNEDPATCPQDCGKFACGNGICEPAENPVVCLQDCEKFACGNGTCEPGETPEGCPDDCEIGCGDCLCDALESFDGCPKDCGFCGDGYCIDDCPTHAESLDSCKSDCCVANCQGRECGPDGCGGSCGNCLPGTSCAKNGKCVLCVADCTNRECGPDGCGFTCGECPDRHVCDAAGICQCLPDCVSKECGFDGCQGSCGSCEPGFGCEAGQCKCLPDCGDRECGPDGCGGLCGQCQPPSFCEEGSCQCNPDCGSRTCGLEPCGTLCGLCPEGSFCTVSGQCECLPDCEGRECGDDSCGGLCGVCLSNELCVEAKCLCQPACEGRACGPDGCGGSCGSCPEAHFCTVDGQCLCLASCSGKACGDDGCGGSCGQCGEGLACLGGFCICAPDCYLKICGDNGCGGMCGGCAPDFTCLNHGCVGAAGSCYDGNKVDWDGCTQSEISEFRVGSHLPGDQSDPSVAVMAGAADAFVVAWHGVGAADADGIGLRIFGGGLPIGPDIAVNTVTAQAQKFPSVAATTGSRIAVVWQSYDSAGGKDYEIRLRIFDSNGVPLTGEVKVNGHDSGPQYAPQVAAMGDGALVVAWEGVGAGDSYGLFARRFDADGQPVGADIQLNQTTVGVQEAVALSAAADGAFLAVWQGDSGDGDMDGVVGRVVDATGLPLTGELVINSTKAGNQGPAALAGSVGVGFFAGWYTVFDFDGGLHGIRGQLLDGAGQPLGPEFPLNTTATGKQTAPAVAMLGNSGVAAVWVGENSGLGDERGIFGHTWDENGVVGQPEEIRLNSLVEGIQEAPAMAAGDNGTILTAWQSETSTTGKDIFAIRLEGDGQKRYR